MNLFIPEIYKILDKIRLFAIKYRIKPEHSGEHIDHQKSKEEKYYDRV
jgi:hypothetical protein